MFFSLQNVTKGARHKIILSIQKLKERQEVLQTLEKVLFIYLAKKICCIGLYARRLVLFKYLGTTIFIFFKRMLLCLE